MTLLELRYLIESLLAELLGTYTFHDSTGAVIGTAPAVMVDEDGSYPPKGTDVTGLEVAIQPNTSDTYTPFCAGDYGSAQQTLITLKQWDLTKTTEAAIARLKSLPNLTEIRPRVPRSSVLDNIETCVLVVTDYS